MKLFDQALFSLQFPSPGKGKSLQQRKAKPPKKQEEKEKRGKGKSQEDELKDTLADDDSSSTTTETSNPDTEPLLREVCGVTWGLRAPCAVQYTSMSHALRLSCRACALCVQHACAPADMLPSSAVGQLCFPWRRAFGNIRN